MTPDTQTQVKQEFMAKYGLPGILGAIDCIHVHPLAPVDNALIYVNWKRTHSINIQVIRGASCKVTHVFANYPGFSHDSFILVNSVIPAVFQGTPGGVAVGRQWLSIKDMVDYTIPHAYNSVWPFVQSKTHENTQYNRKNIWIAKNVFQMSG